MGHELQYPRQVTVLNPVRRWHCGECTHYTRAGALKCIARRGQRRKQIASKAEREARRREIWRLTVEEGLTTREASRQLGIVQGTAASDFERELEFRLKHYKFRGAPLPVDFEADLKAFRRHPGCGAMWLLTRQRAFLLELK